MLDFSKGGRCLISNHPELSPDAMGIFINHRAVKGKALAIPDNAEVRLGGLVLKASYTS